MYLVKTSKNGSEKWGCGKSPRAFEWIDTMKYVVIAERLMDPLRKKTWKNAFKKKQDKFERLNCRHQSCSEYWVALYQGQEGMLIAFNLYFTY